MSLVRIKRTSTGHVYGDTTKLLPGELAIAGKWMWYGPKDTDSGDDTQVQARPIYSPTTLGAADQLLASTGDGDLKWVNAPALYTITLNGTETKEPDFYAPTVSGTEGQYLISQGSKKAPIWTDPINITLNGSVTKNPNFYAPIAAGTDGQIITWDATSSRPVWKAHDNQRVQVYNGTDYITYADNARVTILKGPKNNITITGSVGTNTLSIDGPDIYSSSTDEGTGYYSVSYINEMFNALAGQNEFIGVYTASDLTDANIQSKLNAFVTAAKGRNARNGDLINISDKPGSITKFNGEQWRYNGSGSKWEYYIDWKDTTLEAATYSTLGGVKLGSDTKFAGTFKVASTTGDGFPVQTDANGHMFVPVYGYAPEPDKPTSDSSFGVITRKSDGGFQTINATANVIGNTIVRRDPNGDIFVPEEPTLTISAVSKSYVDKKINVYVDESLLAG